MKCSVATLHFFIDAKSTLLLQEAIPILIADVRSVFFIYPHTTSAVCPPDFNA